MKSICYIIPYFGKLPSNFSLWLISCGANPSINWIIITDDESPFTIPANVKVIYSDMSTIVERFRKEFDFPILVDRPWRLSLFKPAYGEIFVEELKEYDFWGYCDLDLMWGDIRKYYTDSLLSSYERVGNLGHSTLYKNHPEVNSRYRTIVPGKINYIDVFSGKTDYSFDENGMDAIYSFLGLEYYHEVIFAHLEKYEPGFVLGHFPSSMKYKNERQVFVWEAGELKRYYLYEDEIYEEEMLYIHFFCRPMKYLVHHPRNKGKYLIYPDRVIDFVKEISPKLIKTKGYRNFLFFLLDSMWYNRKKITMMRIVINAHNVFTYLRKKARKNKVSN